MRWKRANPSILLASITIIVSLLVMLGWYNRIDYLVQIHPTFAPMQFNTALGFLLSSLSVILLVSKYNRGAAGLAILVFLLAAVTASQYIFGFSAHIDE